MSHYLTSDEIVRLAHDDAVDDEEWARRVCFPICRGIVQTIRGADRDMCDDLVAVGLRETWRCRAKVRPNANAFAYLTQVAKREMIHELRRAGRLDRARAALLETMEQ